MKRRQAQSRSKSKWRRHVRRMRETRRKRQARRRSQHLWPRTTVAAVLSTGEAVAGPLISPTELVLLILYSTKILVTIHAMLKKK